MIVEYTRSFDRGFSKLSGGLQTAVKEAVSDFLDCYARRQFPKGLRVHGCGPFMSLSVGMSTRVFVLPIRDGVKFVFVGNHQDADDYLKR